jgi:hypothetical protein
MGAARARDRKLGRQPGPSPKSDRLAPKVISMVKEDKLSYQLWLGRSTGHAQRFLSRHGFIYGHSIRTDTTGCMSASRRVRQATGSTARSGISATTAWWSPRL